MIRHYRGHWAYADDGWIGIYPNGSQQMIHEDSLNRSEAVLDFIMQFAGKEWCSDKELGQFVRLVRDLLHPQGTLCSGSGCGNAPGKRIENVREVIEKNLKMMREIPNYYKT